MLVEQCGQTSAKVAMPNQSQSSADMTACEVNIREALGASSPVTRLNALMSLYWHMPDDKRDAFVAVLASRLTLVRPGSDRGTA
jgi:hypothetical protein